jgi:hypothetical protein
VWPSSALVCETEKGRLFFVWRRSTADRDAVLVFVAFGVRNGHEQLMHPCVSVSASSVVDTIFASRHHSFMTASLGSLLSSGNHASSTKASFFHVQLPSSRASIPYVDACLLRRDIWSLCCSRSFFIHQHRNIDFRSNELLVENPFRKQACKFFSHI